MTTLFYGLIGLFAAYEMAKAIMCRTLSDHMRSFRAMRSPEDKTFFMAANRDFAVVYMFNIIESVLLVVGLLSSQCFLFAGVLVFSLLRIRHTGKVGACVDSLIRSIGLFIILYLKYFG